MHRPIADMAEDWLTQSAIGYNKHSLENKDGYSAIILMPLDTLRIIIVPSITIIYNTPK